MPAQQRVAENKYHRPMTEVLEDELLRAIRKGQQDAEQAQEELARRGWTPEWITKLTGK